MNRPAVDVSGLPSFAFGKRSILWWATMGMIAIEGTVFALMIAAYIFLKWREPHWPPAVAPPGLLWGTMTTLVAKVEAVGPSTYITDLSLLENRYQFARHMKERRPQE